MMIQLRQYYVFISAPPEITVEKSWVHASEGYDVELACVIHGDATSDVSESAECGTTRTMKLIRKFFYPLTQMMWYQNSFLLDPTDRRSMTSKGERHVLSIKNFQTSDFGNYR